MKTRAVDDETDDPESGEQRRQPQEEEAGESQGDGDVVLNAEGVVGRTGVRRLHRPSQFRPRRFRR